MAISERGLRVPLSAMVFCFAILAFNTARAENAPASAKNLCPTSFEELADKAGQAKALTQLTESTLPGGAVATVEIPTIIPQGSVFCARLKEGDKDKQVGVIAAIPDAAQQRTILKLDLTAHKVDFGLAKPTEFILMSFLLTQGKPDKLELNLPTVAVTLKAKISNGQFAFLGSAVAVVCAYGLIALALGKKKGKYCWNPVYLTSDQFDKASLSRLQLLGFTLLVWGLLVFVLLRTDVLSDISEHILWLLGISAGGTVGVKVAEHTTERLSFENWSWLRNQGWLTVHEEGTGTEPDPSRARWGDLLKATDGSLDIYKFQLAVFSLLVGLKLLTSDLASLASFTIPTNLLTLLGLSNGVYIGGKAIAQSAYPELNKKVAELREAETTLIAKVLAATTAKATPQEKLTPAVLQSAPSEYQAYISKAREAARMLKSLYSGKDDTKFKTEPIEDHELMPRFPETGCLP